MMKIPALLAAALALAIAGCDAEPEAPVDGDIPTAADADGATTSSGAQGEDTEAARRADALRAIPARFLGAWDYVEGSCDPASDLRMEIGQRRIVFYESVGDVTGIRAAGDNAIVVDLTMSGEGETWTQSTRLTLEDGGDRLVPSDADNDGGYEPMPRKRCAA